MPTVEISYNQIELNAAVDFIARNNHSYIGRHDYIRTCIINMMHDCAFKADVMWTGILGFIIIVDRKFEGLDWDINTVRYKIYVDPALGCEDHYDDEYVVEKQIVGVILADKEE